MKSNFEVENLTTVTSVGLEVIHRTGCLCYSPVLVAEGRHGALPGHRVKQGVNRLGKCVFLLACLLAL